MNKDVHFVALTVTGERFGLKLFTKTNNPTGDDKDKLMSDLAGLVEAPNGCPVEQSDGLDFIPEFQGRRVNITRWLNGTVSWHTMPTSIDDDIHNGCEVLFDQLGEWIAFGLVFGIADRNAGNWVWNHSKRQLAMIDMEFCLTPGITLDHYKIPLENCHSADQDTRERQSKALREGFRRMWSKLRQQRSLIEGMLQAKQFAAGYQLNWLDQEADQLIVPFTQRYRL